MRFGSKMQYSIRLLAAQNGGHGRSVANIGLMEAVARIALDAFQRTEIGGVSQTIDIGDGMTKFSD